MATADFQQPYLLHSTPEFLTSCFELFSEKAAVYRRDEFVKVSALQNPVLTSEQQPRGLHVAMEQWQSDETGLAFTTVYMNHCDGRLLPVHVAVSETPAEEVDLSVVLQAALGENKNMVRHTWFSFDVVAARHSAPRSRA